MPNLYVRMDLDDDCQVTHQGKDYCFYGDDLEFCVKLDTMEDCFAYLRTEIKVQPGFKLSTILPEWIEEAIACIQRGDEWGGIHGNQEIEIFVY